MPVTTPWKLAEVGEMFTVVDAGSGEPGAVRSRGDNYFSRQQKRGSHRRNIFRELTQD